ncbi:MAG: hypothetical protein K2N72_00815 [Oscillospiraceae bacterium]|nr:hypothetical protein [Oscillospiraceae bacterium]
MNNNRGFFQTVTGIMTAAFTVTAVICAVIMGLCSRAESAAPVVIAGVVTVVVFAAVSVYLGSTVSARLDTARERLKALQNGNMHIEHKKISDSTELDGLIIAIDEYSAQMDSIVNELGRGLGQLADGNLNHKLPSDWNGDFGKIAKQYNAVANALGSTFKDIAQASSQVTSGTEQVASGAVTLSQGASEQAVSIEELTAQIADISDKVTGTAESAKSTSEIVEITGARVAECSTKMEAMLSAMNDINKSSEEISKIIKVIDDIAFQTNILALNAAVEAARAGAAGKGFAVVADEVRNLAVKSAEAASQTTSLIENSVANVGKGSEIAKETAKILEEIVTDSAQIVEGVARISETSEYQAQEIKRVTDGVAKISSVVKSNTQTAEQSAAASKDLSGQSGILSKLLSHFRFDGESYDSSSYGSYDNSYSSGGGYSDSYSSGDNDSYGSYDSYSNDDYVSSYDDSYSSSDDSFGGGGYDDDYSYSGYEEPSEKPYIDLDNDFSPSTSFSDDFNDMAKDSSIFSGNSSNSDSLKKALGLDTAADSGFSPIDFTNEITESAPVSAATPFATSTAVSATAPAVTARPKPAKIVLDDDDFENVKSKY